MFPIRDTIPAKNPPIATWFLILANGFVFLAGQVGQAPGDSGAVAGGIEAETRQMLDNVGRLLRTVGLDYPDVVKATVYLRDFTEFGAMNAVYRRHVGDSPPARSTVEVSRLPSNVKVEIEAIALA